jgi:hypothetical protein
MTEIHIFNVTGERPPGKLHGHFETDEQQAFRVRDGQPGFLRKDNMWLQGKWQNDSGSWQFCVADMSIPIELGSYEAFDYYWGDRARLALDESLDWQQVDEPGHDHCAICWSTLGSSAGKDVYRSKDGDVICGPCFQQYVNKRSLEFIKPGVPRGKPHST